MRNLNSTGNSNHESTKEAVHRELGPGFLEGVYHAAMQVALSHRAVPFESQVPISISFEGEFVGQARIDLIVGQHIVVELKAVERLHDIHFAQLKSYLNATSLHVGLLLNFHAPVLAIRRVLL
ncbi:MAG: GxxExxY protein [Gemmatimonadales bacterium]|nr:GxxExxY protein [Gemmatimonadales bacterium]